MASGGTAPEEATAANPPSEARTTQALTGHVVSGETKQSLPDVVVTATSPVLAEPRTTVTDAEGNFRIEDVPPGIYALRFEHSEYNPWLREEIILRPGRTPRINSELFQGSESYVAIGPCSVAVDKDQSTTREEILESERWRFERARPSAQSTPFRSLDRVLDVTPGVTSEALGLTIHGATAFENHYLLDRLTTNAPATGANALPVDTEFLRNALIITGGPKAESGQHLGGTVEAITRWGEHSLRGTIFSHWVPRALGSTSASNRVLQYQADFGATIAGPLLENKLWFLAGVAPAFLRTSDSTTPFTDQRGIQALAKLTYLTNAHHLLTLSTLMTSAESSAPSAEATETHDLARLTSLSYSGAAMEQLLWFDVNAGWLHLQDTASSIEHTQERYQVHSSVLVLPRGSPALLKHMFIGGLDVEALRDAPAPALVTSQLVGGYVQDKWYLLDFLTLDAGLRYDAQWLKPAVGETSLRVANTFSPRLGFSLDPLRNYHSRFFAHIGQLQAPLPLGLFAEENTTADPSLTAPTAREFVTGLQYEALRNIVLGATFTHREWRNGLQALTRDDGTTAIVNPGTGLGVDLARSTRRYDAVTVEIFRSPFEEWDGRISYTWSRLRGNSPGLLPLAELRAEADRASLSSERLLSTDRTHVLKASGHRKISFSQSTSAQVGFAYFGASGTPVAGTARRLPWLQSLDAHADARYALTPTTSVTVGLDVFNVLNAQAETRLDAQGLPLQYQPPRQARLSARCDF
ncbi:TonB-dependent receptor [Corallococcus sp. M34]|uniref:TonB-dependent receptor n=1 Tax=Citreicoccus inhibens TaxID=2849499 RepID=UPI001C21B021|nr:TonB-dependent receptor [Citreicoccus inhibens]MBU8899661.1 TonB-dependent receptor [Citreicoccus inhibens]